MVESSHGHIQRVALHDVIKLIQTCCRQLCAKCPQYMLDQKGVQNHLHELVVLLERRVSQPESIDVALN